MKKIVLKVTVSREKSKTLILKTVAKLEGIQSLYLDGKNSTLTVVGNVDAVCIVRALRKKKCAAQIDSVGPPEEKKPDDGVKEPDPGTKPDEGACHKFVGCCHQCSRMPYRRYPHYPVIWYEEPQYGCIIS